MQQRSRYQTARRILIFWTLFIGLGAVAGALAMLLDPSGKSMGMDAMLSYFQVLPFADVVFQDFTFSGWALLIVNGLTNLTAAGLLLGMGLPDEPETMPFDVNYLYGIAAGLIAYVFGRSRRSAFIAGVAGMLLADVAQAVMLWTDGIDQTLRLGGAGMLDTIVISGVSAVLLLGEFIERCVRGAKRKEGARG